MMMQTQRVAALAAPRLPRRLAARRACAAPRAAAPRATTLRAAAPRPRALRPGRAAVRVCATSSGDTPPPKEDRLASIKRFGVAGTLSYVLTELAFWAVAIPGAAYGYHASTGEWLSWQTDRAQLAALAATFVTGVRFAVPLRMGVALACVPFVQKLLDGAGVAAAGADAPADGSSSTPEDV